MTYREMDAERTIAARLCAIYTDAGLYDKAKEKAKRYVELDAQIKDYLIDRERALDGDERSLNGL